MTAASLSIFDLNGPLFLFIYLIGFFIAFIWSFIRRSVVMAKFSNPKASKITLTNPYEIAYLAGGAPRCAQVAVMKLITSGAVVFDQTRFIKESRLISNGPPQSDFNTIERTLHSSISGYGTKGIPVAKVAEFVATRLSEIESKLARLGLRPTASELKSKIWSIVFPLVILMIFGLVKLFVGISHDKPVGFLIFLIIITLISAFIIAAISQNKLTPNGEKSLAKMRIEQPDGDVLCLVALFGVASRASHSLAGYDPVMLKEISQIGSRPNSSGCSTGCSSGCSSGCGGGCGGCGGD